jgi:transposase-like protein
MMHEKKSNSIDMEEAIQALREGKGLGGFANENSLLKLLYAGILKASERWTHSVQNWNLTLSQLVIHFEGRLDRHMAL